MEETTDIARGKGPREVPLLSLDKGKKKEAEDRCQRN